MAVTESKGDGYALYNGVKLPNIDAVWTDKETYPYAFIQTNTIGGACLRVSNAIPFTDGTYIRSENANYMEYDYYADGTEWVYYKTKTGYTGSHFAVEYLLWANYDILNEDGTTYLAASSPIPLDGMNVIEWDGVTDGLETSTCDGIMFYRMSGQTPSNDELIGSVIRAEGEVIIVTEDDIDTTIYSPATLLFGFCLVSHEDNVTISALSLTLKHKGIWMAYPCPLLFAYTPATTEPEEPEEPDTPTVEKFPLMELIMGILSELNAGVKREPIAYLYNGVRLPKLPEWDRGVYPYAVLQYKWGTTYYLYVSKTPLYVEEITVVTAQLYLSNLNGCPTWMTKKPDGAYVWEYYQEFTNNNQQLEKEEDPDAMGKVWWSNFDLMNQTDGTLYLSASEPIPVYE